MGQEKIIKRSLKQVVIEILEEYGYRVDYTPYHSDEDIEEYLHQEKNLDADKYFTIFDEGGYVVCRLSSIQEKTKLLKENVEEICEVFRMFEIPNSEIILENLEKI